MSVLIRFFVFTVGALLTFGIRLVSADSIWVVNPINNDWNTAANWNPAVVPNGPSDTASFTTSNITQISSSQTVQLDGLTSGSGASLYSVTADLVFYGVGVLNASGAAQNIVASESITFTGGSTAGSQVTYAQHGTL